MGRRFAILIALLAFGSIATVAGISRDTDGSTDVRVRGEVDRRGVAGSAPDQASDDAAVSRLPLAGGATTTSVTRVGFQHRDGFDGTTTTGRGKSGSATTCCVTGTFATRQRATTTTAKPTTTTRGRPRGSASVSGLPSIRWDQNDYSCTYAGITIANDSDTTITRERFQFYVKELDEQGRYNTSWHTNVVTATVKVAPSDTAYPNVEICAPVHNLQDGNHFELDRYQSDFGWTWETGDSGGDAIH